jgi:hypothetical protein
VFITTNTTQAANEHCSRSCPTIPVKDFVPVSGLGKGGQIMIVNTERSGEDGRRIHRTREGAARKSELRQRQLIVACGGRDVPADGGNRAPSRSVQEQPLAINDLLGGQINMMITDMATGLPQVKGGKVRALGVSTAKRSPLAPELPTISEAGLKGYEMSFWFAAYVRRTRRRSGRETARRARRGVERRGDAAVLHVDRNRSVHHDVRRSSLIPGGGIGEVEDDHQEGGIEPE